MNETERNSTVKLRWEKMPLLEFIKNKKLQGDLSHVSGIYLWEDQSQDGKPAYIGKATSKTGLWERQLQWYFMQINGQAQIPSKIRRNMEHWEFGTTQGCIDTITDKDSFKALVDDAFDYVGKITVFWAKLDDEDNGSILSDVERRLILDLDPRFNKKKWQPRHNVDVQHYDSVPTCINFNKCPLTKTP